MNWDLPRLVEVIRQHRDEIRMKFKAEVIGLFGSVARGEGGSGSDVDILVRFDEGASLFELVALGDFLEEKLGCKVDIVSDRAVKPELRESIMRDLVRV